MQNQSPSTPQSPNLSEKTDLLAEASPASLEELMNRAPDISDAEADRIIEYLREQRKKFATQEASPKPKKVTKQKGPVLSTDDLLKDIDLNF